jgi:hypothetical protein
MGASRGYSMAVSDMDIIGSKTPKIYDISSPVVLILSWTLIFALEWVGRVLKSSNFVKFRHINRWLSFGHLFFWEKNVFRDPFEVSSLHMGL